MNNQSPFNYSWNAFGTPYSSQPNYQAITGSPLTPMTNNFNNLYSTASHQYNSPSLSSGYGSENSFNNSPGMSGYIPSYNYNNVQYPLVNQTSNNYYPQLNLEPTKPVKRSRKHVELEQASTSIQELNSDDLINNAFESTTQKQKRVYKKRKQDESIVPIIEQNINATDLLATFDDEFDENDCSDMSQSMNGDKKKRTLTRNQRVAANQRERKRMNIMNESFFNLRQALPISTGRKRRKMSRLDIVIGAMEYITYLDDLLKGDGPCEINFDAYQNSLYFYD